MSPLVNPPACMLLVLRAGVGQSLAELVPFAKPGAHVAIGRGLAVVVQAFRCQADPDALTLSDVQGLIPALRDAAASTSTQGGVARALAVCEQVLRLGAGGYTTAEIVTSIHAYLSGSSAPEALRGTPSPESETVEISRAWLQQLRLEYRYWASLREQLMIQEQARCRGMSVEPLTPEQHAKELAELQRRTREAERDLRAFMGESAAEQQPASGMAGRSREVPHG